MLSKQQEADSIALVAMISHAILYGDRENPELRYAIAGSHRLKPRQAPRSFPIEVWREVTKDLESRGYSAWIENDRTVVVTTA